MDTMSAFAMGFANRDKPLMVFDWEKAARLIAERRPDAASAGLEGDWEWTGATIWENGTIPERSMGPYLASTWATPLLEIDDETIECWRYEQDTPGWGAETYWPDEARAIVTQDA